MAGALLGRNALRRGACPMTLPSHELSGLRLSLSAGRSAEAGREPAKVGSRVPGVACLALFWRELFRFDQSCIKGDISGESQSFLLL
ncbi:MAG: hypothetical protein ACPIOQ_02135, partial [Promethearchaeia archaeon]